MNGLISWGFVGCGDVTEVKSGPAYKKCSDFRVQAVMRRNGKLAADYAKRHGVPSYYDQAEALIQDPKVDAVYIATPPDSHLEYALQVADAGKICCIEKPMAPTYAESLQIYEAFEQRNIPLFVAYYRRSLARFEQIKKWLEENRIGAVRSLEWTYQRPPSTQDLSREYNWRTDAAIARGGYFDDLACHGLDLIIWLLGDVAMVKGIASRQAARYTAFDAISSVWQHKNGVHGTGCWNFNAYQRRDEVVITGTKGEIRFGVFGDEEIVLLSQSGTERKYLPNPPHIQQFHVEYMARHLKGQSLHPSTGKSALHTAKVMEAMLDGSFVFDMNEG